HRPLGCLKRGPRGVLPLAGFFASEFSAVLGCGRGEKQDAAAREDTPRASSMPRGYSVFFLTSSFTSSTTLLTVWPATSLTWTPVALSVARITAVATAAAIRTRATVARTKRAKREKALRFLGAGGAAAGGGAYGAG